MFRVLDRATFAMDFIVHERRRYDYEEEIVALGGRVLRCLEPRRPWAHYRNLCRVLRAEGPYDIVHSHVHHYSGLVLAAAARSGVPRRIVHSHTTGTTLNRTPLGWAYRHAMSALVHRYATGGLAASEEAARALFPRRSTCGSGWEVLHCGIDLAPFGADSSGELRAELGLAPGALLMAHVGRFTPEKNHLFLLSVAKEVLRRSADAHLALVGAGELRPMAEAEATRLGIRSSVSFLGSRSDVPALLGDVDVFVFPSVFEGLPLAVLEAQAAGVPAILSAAVTGEVSAVPNLISRLSLSAPVAEWADAVFAATRPTPESRARALATLAGSRFDVRRSAQALADYYLHG